MADFYLTEAGDLTLAPNGDLALTPNFQRDLSQQAYIRVMTEPGDFVLYPNLGSELSALYGLPQSPDTGAYGKQIIEAALIREGVFRQGEFSVTPIPTGPQSIRFDIFIVRGDRGAQLLSIEQDLGIEASWQDS